MPTPEELQALSDDELEALRQAVSEEQIRRHELTNLPAHVDALLQRFVNHGGDPDKIKNPNAYIKGPKPRNPNAG